MAAFSYRCHPFLVESALFFPDNNTPIKPSSSFFMDHHRPLLPSSQNPQEITFGVTNYHETSPVGQTSKITISDNEPSSVTKNQSPETSMVVDKLETGEQVTQKVITPVQRKKRNRNGSSWNSLKSTKETIEGRNKKQKKSNGSGGVKGEEKGKAEKKSSEEPPTATGYIHVRARRGQATDSHSLAERVRREKISERMQVLQKLVPGCDKVTGKALMLDEIINYVQSLQNQVEFLSMKLASVNPMFYDFAMDLDTLMVRPEKLNSNGMAPALPTLLQCSPNQATTFVDTTTVTAAAAAVDAPPSFARANDYLLDNSTAYLLHGQRPNLFSEDNISLFWDVEDQRQKLLNPYGFSNNLCSFH